MNKRRINLGHVTHDENTIAAVDEVIDSDRLSYGPQTRKLENRVAAIHGVKPAVFMASGTCALQVGFEAMKEIHGWNGDSEVIIPATTFIATMGAVIDAGLRPVLCDVEADTFGIDPDRIRGHVTDNTVAVLPVHLLGRACKLDRIRWNDCGLELVEDCCEAVGVTTMSGEHMVGQRAAFAAISTYVCHHLSTGVGGMVLTNSKHLATVCRSLIQHGRDPAYLSIDDDSPETIDTKYRFVRWGHSYRGSELQAALGVAQIDGLDAARKRRQEVASRLNEELQDCELLTLPSFAAGDSPLFYPLVVDGGCEGLVKHFEANGIETRPMMPLLNQKPVVKYLDNDNYGSRGMMFPVACRLIDEAFIIGCHPGMTSEDIEHIGEVARNFFGS